MIDNSTAILIGLALIALAIAYVDPDITVNIDDSLCSGMNSCGELDPAPVFHELDWEGGRWRR